MKRIFAVLLTLVLLGSLCACSSDTEEGTSLPTQTGDLDENGFVIAPKNGDKYVVGIVVKTVESVFYQNLANAVEEEYKDSDLFEVTVQASKTEMDTTGFVQIIEDMVTKDVDLLIVVPGDPEAVRPALENAVAQGIPVICSETDVPGLEGKLTYVGIDNVTAGAGISSYLFTDGILKEGDECALITGPAGYTTTVDRANGTRQGIEENGGVVVAEQPADWDRTKGMEVAENLLTANPNLKYICCSNGEMALGAAEAVASAGKRGEVYITGFDGILDELYAIKEGRMSGTALQDSRQYSLLAMEKYVEYLRGNKLEEFYDIGSPTITPDNVDEYVEIWE